MDIYISDAHGDDILGDGLIGNPYKTIQHAINNSSEGDVFYLGTTQKYVITTPIDLSPLGSNVAYTTVFRPYDDGTPNFTTFPDGSQKMMAVIEGDSCAEPFDLANEYHFAFYNIKFQGFDDYLLRLDSNSSAIECEFNGASNPSLALVSFVGYFSSLISCYLHSYTGAGLAISGATVLYNNIVKGNWIETDSLNGNGQVSLGERYHFYDNIIITTTGTISFRSDATNIEFFNNTIVNNGSEDAIGYYNDTGVDGSNYNNIYYGFDGEDAKPISLLGVQTQKLWGNNAFYDCNSPDVPTIAGPILPDITKAGSPFFGSTYIVSDSDISQLALAAPQSKESLGAIQDSGASNNTGNIFILNE